MRSIFKWNKAGLNSKFSNPLPKAPELKLHQFSVIRIHFFMRSYLSARDVVFYTLLYDTMVHQSSFIVTAIVHYTLTEANVL